MNGFRKGLGEGEAGDRVGRDAVDRACKAWVGEGVVDDAEKIFEREPGHVSAAITDHAAESEAEEREHLAEGTTLRREHDAYTQIDDAGGGCEGPASLLPRDTYAGEKAGAGRSGFVEQGVAVIVVNVDAGGAEENGRRCAGGG